MRMNKVRCTGMMILALLGSSVSTKADSIRVQAVANESGDVNGDLALPNQAAQPRHSGEHHKPSRCCWLGAQVGESFFEDFSWVPDAQRPGFAVQREHDGLQVLTSGPRELTEPVLLGRSATADLTDEDEIWNENGVSWNSELVANGGALYGGQEHLAPWLSIPGLGAFYGGPFGISTTLLNGNGYGFELGSTGVGNGQGATPVSKNAPLPLNVPEPASLALLAAGVAAAGLLILKRTV